MSTRDDNARIRLLLLLLWVASLWGTIGFILGRVTAATCGAAG